MIVDRNERRGGMAVGSVGVDRVVKMAKPDPIHATPSIKEPLSN